MSLFRTVSSPFPVLICSLACALASSCSSSSNSTNPTPTCPPCGAGMVCDEASGTCVASQATCEPACGANSNCLVSGSCSCAQGYSDCNKDAVDGCECATTTCNADGTCGGGTPPPPTGKCKTEGCSPDKVCSADGQCIVPPAIGANDILARLQLRRLVQDGEAKVLGDHGTGGQEEVWFKVQEPLPQDNRQKLATTDNEPCTYGGGMGRWLDNWPSTPMLDAGTVTFTPAGGPGPVVIGAHASDGEVLYWRDTPENLKTGAGSVSNWFSPDYVPYGAAFTVAVAGGPDLGKLDFSGTIPKDFTITAPRELIEGKQRLDQPLKITWDPPQPGAKMELTIAQAGVAGYQDALSCLVADDGSATIPAAALKNFGHKVLLEMRRDLEVYSKVTEPTKSLTVHATIVGRTEHHRWIGFQ